MATLWGALAYLALPSVWRRYDRHSAPLQRPMVTRTSEGIAGDPINIGLIAGEEDVVCAFTSAGWSAANAVTLASSIRIVGSVVLHRPYLSAPVSALFYEGRREDLAFESPFGSSADKRHHVRLWRASDGSQDQKPLWLGAASFDRSVGFSHYTLQVTHHIDPDVDAERDFLMTSLAQADRIEARYTVSGAAPTIMGRNGGGDHYFTDGEVTVADLAEGCTASPKGPTRPRSPWPAPETGVVGRLLRRTF